MRTVVAGTAGHIDHGKTELVRALTGTNPDRLKEEQERGITIDIGFAHLDYPDLRLAFIDVPGHERFVKNMLAGASGIDLVLLVVAADESVKPQTREHLDICRLLGVRHGIIALTKSDLADGELQELASLEIRELAAGTFLDGARVVPVSSRTGEGLDGLSEALRDLALGTAERPAAGPVRLPVDRSFSIRGFGTVVTGTLASGTLEVGDELELLPAGTRARVRRIEVHNADVETASAGQRTAVNLQGIPVDGVRRGDVIVTPDAFLATRMHDARVSVLADSPVPLRDLARVRFHAGTAEILARVRTLGAKEFAPGETGLAQIRMESEAVLAPDDRFILRRYSPARTIAGGLVLDPAPPKRRRGDAASVEALRSLADAGPDGRLSLLTGQAGEAGLPLSGLAARCGIGVDVLRRAVERLSEEGPLVLLDGESPRVVSSDALSGIRKRAESILAEFHAREPLRPGLSKGELKARLLGDGPQEVFRAAIEGLRLTERLRLDRDVVALASHRVELSGGDLALRDSLEKSLRDSGLDPPAIDRLTADLGAPKATAERILHLLQQSGKIRRLPDGRLIHAHALADLRRKLYAFRAERETIDIASFKDLAGVSRKNAIPLLEHFDAERVTVRRGNDRLILPER